jgi:hypothetical protein
MKEWKKIVPYLVKSSELLSGREYKYSYIFYLFFIAYLPLLSVRRTSQRRIAE